jgi:ATP-binding cassette subfamily F protein 3
VGRGDSTPRPGASAVKPAKSQHEEKKRLDAEARKKSRELDARRKRIEDLESRIAAAEQEIRDLEATMSGPGFYDDRSAAQPVIDRHQALMWKVGDLMHQWEELQAMSDLTPAADR